jgi:hypothetical protein
MCRIGTNTGTITNSMVTGIYSIRSVETGKCLDKRKLEAAEANLLL